jgi:hypothetical protein
MTDDSEGDRERRQNGDRRAGKDRREGGDRRQGGRAFRQEGFG